MGQQVHSALALGENDVRARPGEGQTDESDARAQLGHPRAHHVVGLDRMEQIPG